MTLTDRDKTAIIGLGVSMRLRRGSIDVGTEEAPKIFTGFIVDITGTQIYGTGMHETSWLDAGRLAWADFWAFAERVIELRADDKLDPLTQALAD